MEFDLTEREWETLKFIIRFRADNFQASPSAKEILEHLNKVLPERQPGRPALVSKQQVHRVVVKLRAQGLLVDPEATPILKDRHRNFIPTKTGERYVRAREQETKRA